MKFRRVNIDGRVRVEALHNNAWRSLDTVPNLQALALDFGVTGNLAEDVIAVLQLGSQGFNALAQELDRLQPVNDLGGKLMTPIDPTSFRDFMLFEDHVINASRGYVKKFMPAGYQFSRVIEAITGKPFWKFKPHQLWYQQPIYYFSNHLNFLVCGEPVPWPGYTSALDYELELGAILTQPLFNATPEEAEKAIGGFVVLNDLSARDQQLAEMDCGFGPQKAKHFSSVMSSVVVSADEVLPKLSRLEGSVSINDEFVASCSTKDMYHSFQESIAFASRGEKLHPGELFGSGTLPGGSGMENGRWLSPDDVLELEIKGIGHIKNKILSPLATETPVCK
ncbi:fumarylacetoacetate hydrolase family protein [Maricurvus nonylphenolicus]|uniref:fumarylacetoacetate hydrolase family protein n=1 Tax=Maricurvus nonylphenolicus TaxID=1008307 RepID=UPI0036F38149